MWTSIMMVTTCWTLYLWDLTAQIWKWGGVRPLEEVVNQLYGILNELIEGNIPLLKEKKKKPPWLSSELIQLLKKRIHRDWNIRNQGRLSIKLNSKSLGLGVSEWRLLTIAIKWRICSNAFHITWNDSGHFREIGNRPICYAKTMKNEVEVATGSKDIVNISHDLTKSHQL